MKKGFTDRLMKLMLCWCYGRCVTGIFNITITCIPNSYWTTRRAGASCWTLKRISLQTVSEKAELLWKSPSAFHIPKVRLGKVGQIVGVWLCLWTPSQFHYLAISHAFMLFQFRSEIEATPLIFSWRLLPGSSVLGLRATVGPSRHQHKLPSPSPPQGLSILRLFHFKHKCMLWV